MVAGGAACSDAPWVPAMSVTVTATNSPRVNVMFPLEAEHRSEDDARLLALEVPSPFTHHPHVALVQVMHAGGGSTVLGEVACALVLLTESERNNRAIGIDPVVQRGEKQPAGEPLRPDHGFG